MSIPFLDIFFNAKTLKNNILSDIELLKRWGFNYIKT